MIDITPQFTDKDELELKRHNQFIDFQDSEYFIPEESMFYILVKNMDGKSMIFKSSDGTMYFTDLQKMKTDVIDALMKVNNVDKNEALEIFMEFFKQGYFELKYKFINEDHRSK